MEYIQETGRQLKIGMKEHDGDSKVDFWKKFIISMFSIYNLLLVCY